jgi:S-adenosyl-L-methionine hydrolase (adenosine-forming)
LSRSVITLTTDFGSADYFVGVMKGVVLNINPEVQLVDLSHEVASFNVLDGALTIGLNYAFFPEGTIHVVVVDPGVGSARRPIIARAAHHTFVAPDNGVLSVVFEREATLDVRQITADRYFLHPVSSTFHGRDIFAPVAGWLSRGVPAEDFGGVIKDYVRITIPRPRRLNHQQTEASVIRVDKFGNLMTNLRWEDLPERISPERPPFKIIIKGREIARLAASFAEGSPSEPFSYIGSSGFLEIALNEGSAAQLLSAGPGTEITLHINDPSQP